MNEQVKAVNQADGRVLVDRREFARFILTGIIATVGNLAAVWALRRAMPYEAALACGIATGFAISFALTRLFAFRPARHDAAARTLARFLMVYAAGVAVNMVVAVLTGRAILPLWLSRPAAEMAGAFLGAGTMTFTSYFGHRFFTYRTGTRAGADQGGGDQPAKA